MTALVFRRNTIVSMVCMLQIAALFFYLFANIINIGELGTALPALLLYILLSFLALLILSLGQTVFLRMHFLVFLVYLLWVSIRVVVDLNDLNYLKQIIFATTGGILLFYIMGAALAVSVYSIIENNSKNITSKIVLLFYIFIVAFLTYDFSQKLSDLSVLYISDADGYYQRPGNFISISFIVVSTIFYYYCMGMYEESINRKGFFFWLTVYSVSAFLLLAATQMIGSNSATVVIVGCYLITIVTAFITTNKKFISSYNYGTLNIYNSKKILKKIIFFSSVCLLILLIIFSVIVNVTNFDLNSIRLFGFGSGNTSLSSRLDILTITGLNQLSYAPIFGDMDVAFKTTGDSGRTLHSFLPYVMANLGLVGLIIVSILFYMIFRQLINGTKRSGNYYKKDMISLFSVFMISYVFLFANVSVGIEWAVLNFSIGFFSRPIYFKCKE